MRDFLEDAEGAVERGEVGPGKANRGRDIPTLPKRFYSSVDVDEDDAGFAVLLDNKPVKTPGRNPLVVSTKKGAELVAAEWAAVQSEINPLLMPVTRIVNTAIDGVATEMQAVIEDIIRYAASDLLCYRADAPEGLVDLQRQHWDRVLDWIENEHAARFDLAEGVMHIEQPREAIQAFGNRLRQHADPIKMACLHTFTSLSGSALLSLALAEEFLNAEQAWKAAHVDEAWNVKQWGEDHEALERRLQRWTDFEAADRLIKAVAS